MTSGSRSAFALVLALLAAPGHAASERTAAEAEVRRLLAGQVEAWNRGDVEGFTSVYDERALFVTDSGTTRGRAEVTARYRSRYPDGKTMGKLTLDVEELRLTGSPEVAGARVLATWTLVRDDGARRSGPTLIVLERRDGRWWITEDASMESAPPK